MAAPEESNLVTRIPETAARPEEASMPKIKNALDPSAADVTSAYAPEQGIHLCPAPRSIKLTRHRVQGSHRRCLEGEIGEK